MYLSNDLLVNQSEFGFNPRHSATDAHKASFKQLLALEAAGYTEYVSEAGTYDLAQALQSMPANLRKNIANRASDG